MITRMPASARTVSKSLVNRPVPIRNSFTALELAFQAAGRYSLIRPCTVVRRSIRAAGKGITAGSSGLRKARYRGLKKIEREHYIAATAINLIRLDAYLADQPIDRGHTGRLLRLHAALTN